MKDATFFADRTEINRGVESAMLLINMNKKVFNSLTAAGAKVSNIPGGSRIGFEGKQVFVPPSAFPIFDQYRSNRQINMVILPRKVWDIGY